MWNSEMKPNYILGHYLQYTGGDFYVIEHTVSLPLVKKGKGIYEINITGNIPTAKYNYSENYDVLMANFILKGKIIGSEELKDLGTYYVFDVEDYAEYVPRIWNLSVEFLSVCVGSFLLLPFLSLYLLFYFYFGRAKRLIYVLIGKKSR
ncbi:hypothetical protein QNI19_30515 [Cytophagaceae bacterium DM2B3-1]|uniref:Uncharacterized protein n=2 Tax=Xanthocytophaga flava TaxID=3048013 RepID=A0ABT7CU63_9BACT|nr:hypothetical protein [Xanthocytophaga flavus]MDJ1469143.1 hypothetical protein [Xanthocytophaga flavus]MDJ1497311.1 hypothetical protein [Xanthocytophaga flavus]